MALKGDRPLQRKTYNSGWMNTVVRVGIGCVALTATTAAAQAQTYYYYPTSGTGTPVVTSGTTTTPTYSYRRGLFGRRIWTSYTPQSYQTTYSTQYSQPASPPQVAQQTETAQTSTSAQIIPASYSPNSTAGTATTTTALVLDHPREAARKRAFRRPRRAIRTVSLAGSIPPGQPMACRRLVTIRISRTGPPKTTITKRPVEWAIL